MREVNRGMRKGKKKLLKREGEKTGDREAR